MSDCPPCELEGQVAIVTGSSRGIGKAIALRLAQMGADVLVHAGHHLDAAQAVGREIESLGRRTCVLVADLADARERGQFVAEAWAWQGQFNIWINNAGADVLTGEAAGWDFARKLEHLWRVDVCGTISLSRQAGRLMYPRGGNVLNMGWDQAEVGMAGESGEMFATTKGAIMAFTRSLSKSLAPNVRVNCLAPGWIRTAWGDQATPYWQARASGEALLNRWGTPADVANAAGFLVSPRADFMTGQVIAINGGFAGSVCDPRQRDGEIGSDA